MRISDWSSDVCSSDLPITVGTVTGVALNAVDQKPLAGVKVTLGTLSTTTDVQGRFTLYGVQAGDASVQGSKAVFRPASQGVRVLAAKDVDVTRRSVTITPATPKRNRVEKTTHTPIARERGSDADTN